MLREELRTASFAVHLVSDRLGAVLAELGEAAIPVRLRPGAAHAVDAPFLIQHRERFHPPQHARVLEYVFRRPLHARQTGRFFVWLTDPQPGEIFRGLSDYRPVRLLEFNV